MNDIEVSKIFETRDYSKFGYINGNRIVLPTKLKKVEKTMSTTNKDYYGFLQPILVNEHYQIIDGQHRFQLSQKHLQPVRYIVQEGAGLEEVILCNAEGNPMSQDDQLRARAALGLTEEQIVQYYSDLYGLSLPIVLLMLTNKNHNIKKVKLPDNYENNFDYNYSLFKDTLDARKVEYITNKFVAQALVELYNKDDYDHDRFIQNIKDSKAKEFPVSAQSIGQAREFIKLIYEK